MALNDEILWVFDQAYREVRAHHGSNEDLDRLGDVEDFLRRVVAAADDLWSNIDAASVNDLTPETVEFCKELHDQLYHKGQ